MPRRPKRIRDFRERMSSLAPQSSDMSMGLASPAAFLTAAIWALRSAQSKSTLLRVENMALMTMLSVSGVDCLPSRDCARATRAPVSSSCRRAASVVFPQTPADPVQPLPPAVCSHWKQNILSVI